MSLSMKVDYPKLISKLKEAFGSDDHHVPERMHLNLPANNIALVMPAWTKEYYGLKQIIACPENPKHDLPTIQGRYNLFNVLNGSHLAEIDAAKLTAIRTAATSVLASSFFVDKPKKLVILGNGVIGKHLNKAYNQYYQLEQTVVWSRSIDKTIDLEKELKEADMISCATHAYEPILKGKWIKGNPHIDLIGSYKPNMREVDDDLIQNADIYIDDEPALKESGDLFIPLSSDVISKSDIKGTLFDLCQGKIEPMQSNRPTVFKSVGHAIEDLVAAIYFYENQ
jgi:ornithine cyclodeaminase